MIDAAARRFMIETAERSLPDRCQRLAYSEGIDADGRETGPVYTNAEVMPCGFSWGGKGDTDQTQARDDRTVTTPRLRVPLSSTFRARDQVRLTHRYGQAIATPLVFRVEGDPLPGVTVTILELRSVRV